MKLELSGLRVIGCGPLRDVCIDFRDASGKVRPVTVLGGANGSGKTTVLELIVELSAMLHPKVGGIGKTLASAKYAQLDWLLDGNAFSIYRGVPPTDATLPNSPGATIGRWQAYAQNAVVVER